MAPPDTPFETVADEVFRRYARNWKPSPRMDSCMTATAVNPVCCRLREEAELSDVRLHDCRHSFASQACEASFPACSATSGRA